MIRRGSTLLIGVAALLSACTPEPVTSQGAEVDTLYSIFFWVAAGVFTITAGLIGWSIIRYRAKPGDEELPPQFHQNVKLEIIWFAIPQVIVIVLFVLSAFALDEVNEQKADPDATVRVTAFQWGWRFEYEGAGVEVVGTPQERAEVVVPTGDVAFILGSADVVHSFYVPQFLIKRDMFPGRDTRIDVTLDEPGEFAGVCTEFCGLLHDQMTFTIVAMEPSAFARWLEERSEAGP
jgi:cytochrome c oxidase subunit II